MVVRNKTTSKVSTFATTKTLHFSTLFKQEREKPIIYFSVIDSSNSSKV
jgi:hypothetical protein